MFFMRNMERNRPLLLSIVVDGNQKWRKVAGAVWRGLFIDNDLLDSVFRYFVLQAGPNPAQQLLILHGQMQMQERERWDKRNGATKQLQANLRTAMADLKHSQRRKH